MNYIHLPIGLDAPKRVNAVVEVPLGDTNKYEFDPELEVFKLDRPMFSSVHYPCEYGFIPSTLGEDGDPLDCLILAECPSFSGCVVEVRPIGLMEMVDEGKPDEKVLCVATQNPSYREVMNCTDVFPHLLKEIEHFFLIYKELEDKHTEVMGWQDSAHACEKIVQCHERFKSSGFRVPSSRLA